jgi:hypothetical protein
VVVSCIVFGSEHYPPGRTARSGPGRHHHAPAAGPHQNPEGGGSIFTLRPAVQGRTGGPGPLGDVHRPFAAYWRAFVAPQPPLGTQRPGHGGDGTSPRDAPSPPCVVTLGRRVWHGSTARWYPIFAVIDVDAPQGGYDAAMRILETHLGWPQGSTASPVPPHRGIKIEVSMFLSL